MLKRLSHRAAEFAGAPVLAYAAVGKPVWWARARQFRRSAYLEVWNDAGFDAESVVDTPDVFAAMANSLVGGCELSSPAADVVFRAALTFASPDCRLHTGPVPSPLRVPALA